MSRRSGTDTGLSQSSLLHPGGTIDRPAVGSGRCGAQLGGTLGIAGPGPVQVIQPAGRQANLDLAGRRADAGIEAFDRPQERRDVDPVPGKESEVLGSNPSVGSNFLRTKRTVVRRTRSDSL
jgi:hypothetical protein